MERVSLSSKLEAEKESLLVKSASVVSEPKPPSIGNSSPVLQPMNQLLNSMSQRGINKPKYGNFSSNFQQKVRSVFSTRCFLLTAGLLVVAYVMLYYYEFIANKSAIFIPSSPFNLGDRSTTYNVKILPSLLSDEELNQLPKESFSYLAMIDAGSSGCRAHIYRYGKLGSLDGPLYVLPQHKSKKITPGLSSFANNPQDAGLSLAGLIDFMKEQVPEADWSVTPIWLKATAGLRILPSSQSEAILDSVRKFLLNSKNSPFYFRYSFARIIPGTEEGGFGWIAFNYLKKVIGPRRPKTVAAKPYAVIEMGGASAQVSQLAPSVDDANKIPKEFRFSFDVEGEEYHLYTHSYLGYGAEQAMAQFDRLLKDSTKGSVSAVSPSSLAVVKDPCKHEGFLGFRKERRQLSSSSPHHSRRALEESHGNTTTARRSVVNSEPALLQEDVSGLGTGVRSSKKASTSPSCVQSVASLFTTITSFGSSIFSAASKAVSPTASANNDGGDTKSLCSTTGPHSFACVYQPDFVISSQNILAFENFFYMSSALGVKPAMSRFLASKTVVNESTAITTVATTFPLETTPENIREASETFCSLPWSEVQANYPKDAQAKAVNMKTCFLSAFSYSFLVDGLKLPSNKVITIQKEVESSEIEWALGAAYKETADFLKRTHLRPN
jgi:Golgi nucleoside diphosphatase